MIPKICMILLAVCIICRAEQAGVKDTFFLRYNVIYENNIYLKNRQAVKEPDKEPVKSILKENPVPVEMRILTGVVDNGEEFIAFFEDMSMRKTHRIRKGDVILNKLVESINIDGVSYTENGSSNRVKVGERIAGISSSAAAETSVVPSAVTYEKPMPVEIVEPSAIRIIDKPDEKTLLERLRLRRQREMQ
ncbi:MAG TPA: hypothetical protein PKN36_00755 [bacterium]|nr:hypothetical protein [bacterium]